jgi:hypothetical protein
VRKLQTLGAVQGHQDDGVAPQLLLFLVIQLAVAQRHLVQEIQQIRPFRLLLVRRQRVDDLLDGIPASLLLVRVGVQTGEFSFVVDLVDQLPSDLDQRLADPDADGNARSSG